LEALQAQITSYADSTFRRIKNNKFYYLGVAEEAIERMFLTERSTLKEAEFSTAAPDLLGKIQSLALYYSLIAQYCESAIIQFDGLDKDIAKAAEELIES
jgi:hypothetical protein